MKIEISKSYERISISRIAQHIDDEIQYHENTHNCKPKKLIIAPYHEWHMHKESKSVAVICLLEEHIQ